MISLVLNNVLLPIALSATRSNYRSIARQTSNRQRWAADKIKDWQATCLRELLVHAIENVPYYQERFGDHPVPRGQELLEQFPEYGLLTKSDVEANFPDRIVDRNLVKEDSRTYGTRGTTHRIVILNDFDKRDWIRAGEHVTMTESCGYRMGKRSLFIPPDACNTLCGIDGTRSSTVTGHLWKMIREGKWSDSERRSDLRGLVMNNWVFRRTVLEPFGPEGTHIGEDRLRRYVTAIRRQRPYLLKALPEYLQMIARYIIQSGDQPPTVPEIRPMGSLMSPTMKAPVEQAFGGRVREDYGSADLGPMAFDCGHGDGMHMLHDHYYFECVRDGQPVPDGELGSLVVTDLHNRAMPLIRYRIGDVVRIDRTPCRCGRFSPRIIIEGRQGDVIVLPSGRSITPRMACEFFFSQPEIDQFQLIERSPRRVELNFVRRGDTFDGESLCRRFAEFTGDTRQLVMREANSIMPEASGKFRHTKSRSSDRFENVNQIGVDSRLENELESTRGAQR